MRGECLLVALLGLLALRRHDAGAMHQPVQRVEFAGELVDQCADGVQVADVALVHEQFRIRLLQPDLRCGHLQPLCRPADPVHPGAEGGQAGRGGCADAGATARDHDVDRSGERRGVGRPPVLAQERADGAVPGDDQLVQHPVGGGGERREAV